MKLYLSLCLFLCIALPSMAQTGFSVKGSVTDTSSKLKLRGTTICVLNAKDSIMRKFTYAHDDGKFAITGLPAGNFILLVSYPDYADYVERFTLDPAHPSKDFGPLDMQLKSKILKDVMVKGTVNAIKIKGDTTEFNAKAYVIQPNDKVEDLIRQFPGIQVDKDGKITANGQAINKVLVDGEEFFGDDPTLVTKNLRADMVDKVQMFDKKSDQAAFTGIDDGKKTKVLNVVLKEDKKSGTFGKLVAGVATRGYYEGQAIYNRFKAKQKYSAYGTSASDGKVGLGFNDNNNLGTSGGNVSFGDDGSGYVISFGPSDGLDSFDGTYSGYGKPKAHNGGLHFDNKFNNDKSTVNANYRVGGIDIDGITTTITQQNLGQGAEINTVANQTNKNSAFRNKFDLAYTYKPDTITSVKFTIDGTFKNFTVQNNYNTESTNENGDRVNMNDRRVNNNGNQRMFNASVFYTRKLKKYGRTFSWGVSEAYNANYTKGFLNSETRYYDPVTSVMRDSLLDQMKTTHSVSQVLNSNITYSEPLSRFASIVFNYGLGFSNSTADRRSYNPSGGGEYQTLDATFSNNYRFLQTTNQVGANFSYKKKKITFNAGTKASNVDFKQTDVFTSNVFNRSFINWQPQANFQYRPSTQKSFSFNYNGFNQQPTIDQIQPIRDNSNPLNVVIGNANLKPSFSHGLSVNYNAAKILSGANTYFFGFMSLRENAITNNTITDRTTGRSTVQYINLADERPINYSASVNTSRKIKAINTTVGLGVNTNGNINYNYINNELNRSSSYTYGASVNINKYEAKKFSLSVNGGPRYTINKFSARPDNDNNAAGFSVYSYNTLYLPAKFILGTDANYNYTAPTSVFPAQYRTIWNASLAKTFFKGDNLKLAVNANDILNQNVNFFRNISGNTITQTTNNSIGRFILFSVSWDFTKFGTEPAKQ